MANYRDETHIKPNEFNIDQKKISPEVKKLATFIREKMYGVDVREAIALAVELISTSNFGELDKARTNINGYEFNTLADRLDAIEKVAKQLGLPIDPREESEELNG